MAPTSRKHRELPPLYPRLYPPHFHLLTFSTLQLPLPLPRSTHRCCILSPASPRPRPIHALSSSAAVQSRAAQNRAMQCREGKLASGGTFRKYPAVCSLHSLAFSSRQEMRNPGLPHVLYHLDTPLLANMTDRRVGPSLFLLNFGPTTSSWEERRRDFLMPNPALKEF